MNCHLREILLWKHLCLCKSISASWKVTRFKYTKLLIYYDIYVFHARLFDCIINLAPIMMTNDIYEQFLFFSSNKKVIKNTNDLASCLKYKNALAFPLSTKNNSFSIPTTYISFVSHLLTAIADTSDNFIWNITRQMYFTQYEQTRFYNKT